MSQELCELEQVLPCRRAQLTVLHNLFMETPYVDAVFVYGGPATGKSTVVEAVLAKMRIKYTIVDLVECYTSRILFEKILANVGDDVAKCDNMMEFVDRIRAHHRQLRDSVIIVDHAEKLRNMEFNLLMGLVKLHELSGVRVSVVLLSQIILQKFYPKGAVVQPLKIYFPQYKPDELLEILTLDYTYMSSLVHNTFNDKFEFDIEFYRNYLNVFLSTFYRVCRDLAELRHNARTNFIKYCRPIIDGEIKSTDSLGLWRRFAPILKTSLDSIYLRMTVERALMGQAHGLELPFYAKYLLIAAYLASYNPAKDDKRLFMKHHGKKRKTLRNVKKKSKVSEELATQLGAKPFSLDRLLAIFYAILDDKVGFNNNLLIQISSLVELQLLSALSDNCVLDGARFKCNVNFDFVQAVAKMVGFNIRKYLSDFCHM